MGKKITNKDLEKENLKMMKKTLCKNLDIMRAKRQLECIPNVQGLTLEHIKEQKAKGQLLDRARMDYEDLSGTPISFKCCKTLEDGVGWYAHQYPQFPNDLYYYLTRTTMGFPVTKAEIEKTKKNRRRFLRKHLNREKKQFTKKNGNFVVKFQ